MYCPLQQGDIKCGDFCAWWNDGNSNASEFLNCRFMAAMTHISESLWNINSTLLDIKNLATDEDSKPNSPAYCDHDCQYLYEDYCKRCKINLDYDEKMERYRAVCESDENE